MGPTGSSDGHDVSARDGDAGGSPAGADEGGRPGVLTPERLARYRERLLEAAILGCPIAVIEWGVGRISARLTSQPWHILWFVVPLALAAWVAWQGAMKRRSFRIRGAMLVFFICYLSAFSLAGASDLLVWKRSTVIDPEEAPRHWLLPAGWGDWRYRFAARDAPEPRLVVMTMEPPEQGATRSAIRFELARLIQLAASKHAAGVAFDFHFGPEPSEVDAFLCGIVHGAGIPVMAGERVVRGSLGIPRAEGYPSSVEPCFPEERRGHLLAYRDADGVVRNVGLRTREGWDSLGLKVAAQLSRDRPQEQAIKPEARMMQFLFPDPGFPVLEYETLASLPSGELDVLKGRFLLVGERSRPETFHTPFGDRLGVEVHAAAVGALLAGHWITQPPWWSGLLILVVACYLVAALAADGASARKLVAVALGISAFVVAAAALAMRLWYVWLDVVYPLAAVWPLLGLLLLLRRRLGAMPATR